MKLARLMLQAFGPFTDKEIDFTGTGTHVPDLHIIYGPNEAGKSSALRAITDLRFGVPPRSTDVFLHVRGQLRISGIFIDTNNNLVCLTRRKGRGATLYRCDSANGEPMALAEVTREQEAALTGGLGREEFEAMFGLNHERLRAGGDLLVRGEGELGSALFEASAGTRGIAQILASLEADAKALFNPHGRAQAAVINEARKQLEEQRQAWKRAQTRPAEWQALNRAHEEARSALDELEKTLQTQRRKENELTELRTVAPILTIHDRAVAEIESIGDVPDLPETAAQERLSAEQAIRHAKSASANAELEISRCASALDALTIEQALIEHAAIITRLAGNIESVSRSRVEAQQQQAAIAQQDSELEIAKGRLAPGRTINEILTGLPSEADRVSLDRHIAEIGKLRERLNGYQQRADDLKREEMLDSGTGISLPDPLVRQALGSALRDARGLLDIAGRTVEFERTIETLGGEVAQKLADLGIASTDELRLARPLLEAQISAAGKQIAETEENLRRIGDEDAKLVEDVEQQELRKRGLAAEGEVVTAETLRLARERRDQGWTRIRKAYIHRSHSVEELETDFDADRALPEAFEAAQGDADRQADLLRTDATRAARMEECSGRIEAMARRRQELGGQASNLAKQCQELLETWSTRLRDHQLPALDPGGLREWQTVRQLTLQDADRLAETKNELARLTYRIETAKTSLASALQAAGQPAETSVTLSSLVSSAEEWEKAASDAEAEQRARARRRSERLSEQQRVQDLSRDTKSALDTHVNSVEAWQARLFMAPDSTSEAVKARLEELDSLARQCARIGETKQRHADAQSVVNDFTEQAKGLASILGEPDPSLPDDFVERLRARLDSSLEQQQRKAQLTRDKERAQETKENAEKELSVQLAILIRLCAAAGVQANDELPQREESAARKRQLRATIATQRDQLASASSLTDEELRHRLGGRDAISIEEERERCRQEIARLEEEQQGSRQTEEQTRRALEAIDSSDAAAVAREAMESAAARIRSAIRPWGRLKLAHVILQQALNRFRERAQAPMVASGSAYFSLMTGGRYQRLIADDTEELPVLQAEREDGVRIGVNAMSEGTADQLYLALRLAALELRRESHPQMPLVLDDVLITSDDERAGNILKALARFSESGQVLLFTHHRHLLDVARAALGTDSFASHTL